MKINVTNYFSQKEQITLGILPNMFLARVSTIASSRKSPPIFNPCNQQVDCPRSCTANVRINSAGKFNYRPSWQVLENQLSETIYRILGVPCGFRELDCLSPTPIAGTLNANRLAL